MERFLNAGPSGFKPKLTQSLEKAVKEKKKKVIATPWVEKYRPKSVDDVVQQEEVVAVLKKALISGDLPNLLFFGPPGTGKTSTILALAKDIFGELFRSRTLELNASDERGIQVIREKVKAFSQQSAAPVTLSGKKCPPFKIVILDEADSMTGAAQAALRRTMEKETKSTRFCLICNYVSRIIEPLTSRCSKFRFKPLSTDLVINRLQYIVEQENVKCEIEVLESIVQASEGDMRKAITTLQCAHRLKGDSGITVTDINDIAGVVPKKWIEGLIAICKSDSYDKLNNYITELMYEGFTASQVMNQLHDLVIESSSFNDKQRSVICEKIGVCDKRLLDGADEYLQLMDLCTLVMTQICHSE